MTNDEYNKVRDTECMDAITEAIETIRIELSVMTRTEKQQTIWFRTSRLLDVVEEHAKRLQTLG